MPDVREPDNVSMEDVQKLLNGSHGDPFSVLGRHQMPPGAWVVRAFAPEADTVEAIVGQTCHTLHEAAPGLFVGPIPGDQDTPYKLRRTVGRAVFVEEDPFRFGLVLSSEDAHRLKTGGFVRAFEVLGAHPIQIDGVDGAAFAVWAPDAQRVAVVGAFNDWNARRHPMRYRLEAGVWEIFLPGVAADAPYAFDILTSCGVSTRRQDPYAGAHRANHAAPRNRQRPDDDMAALLSADLRPWLGAGQDPAKGAEDLFRHATELGLDGLILSPLYRQAQTSTGLSPVSMLTPDPVLGDVDALLQALRDTEKFDLARFMTFDPSGFAAADGGLMQFDGGPLYEHPGAPPPAFEPNGPILFRHDRYEVGDYVATSALFWLEAAHLDGLVFINTEDVTRWPGASDTNADGVGFLRRLSEALRSEAHGVTLLTSAASGIVGAGSPTRLGGLGYCGSIRSDVFDAATGLASEAPEVAAWRRALGDALALDGFSRSYQMIGTNACIETQRCLAALTAMTCPKVIFADGDALFPTGADGTIDWRGAAESAPTGYRALVRSIANLRSNVMASTAPRRLLATDGPATLIVLEAFGRLCIANLGAATARGRLTCTPSAASWRIVLNSNWRDFGGDVLREAVRQAPLPVDGLDIAAPAKTTLILEPESLQ